jgi:prolyl-tRNA editing enzyme YbaK/EbsC (Cys-tRNA(Pro) deacylase)
MIGPMHPNVERVVAAARSAGLDLAVERFPATTRTAVDAAGAIGCEVAQIVKSLVFVADGHPVIALVSGANRADAAKLARALDAAEVRRADAAEARAATGFAIGGVPPFGHAGPLPVLVDRDLTGFTVVHAAAGLPDATFPIAPADLVRASGGRVVDLAEADAPAPPG